MNGYIMEILHLRNKRPVTDKQLPVCAANSVMARN